MKIKAPNSKIIVLLFTCLIFLACKEEKKFGESFHYKTELDSTYHAIHDSIVLNEDIKRDNYLNLPATKNWQDIVRLRGRSSWGTFDYICSIYNDESKRIQLIRQNKFPKEDVNYIYKERILSNEEFDTIMSLIKDNGIYEMPFDLEPDFMLIDGGEYNMAIKKKDFTKVIFWQDEHRGKSENKEKARKVFKEILYRADYPFPKGYVTKKDIVKDSISYQIGLDDYDLFMNFYAEYKGKEIPSDGGNPILILSKKDTSTIKGNVRIFVTLGNGDKDEIKEIIIEN